jgi:Mce-associated membrane protein
VTPTWYDVLGVEPDASSDEVRAAWREGIADLEPGDRRFASLNDAAAVLLDDDRRAAYDAELAPAEPEPEPVDLTKGEVEQPTSEPAPAGRGVPGWVLAALAVLVAVVLVAAGYLYTQPSDAQVADATTAAQAAAEDAATTILSYDYRRLDQDQKASQELMTSAYRAKYDPLFEQIKANAPDLQVVVSTTVVASAITRASADRVQVLLFVNRPTKRADQEQPEEYRDQVKLTMLRSGSDWLVDDMVTSPGGA